MMRNPLKKARRLKVSNNMVVSIAIVVVVVVVVVHLSLTGFACSVPFSLEEYCRWGVLGLTTKCMHERTL